MSDAVGETPEVRPVTSVLYRLGGLGARHPWRVIGAWMLVVLAVGALSATYGGGPTQSLGVPGSDSQRAFDLLEDRFPEQFGGRARVVFAVDGDRDITAASYRSSIEAVLDGVRDAPGVQQVIDPFGPAAAFFVSPDSRTAFAEVVYEVKAREVSDSEIETLVATGSLAEQADLTIGFGGEVVEQLEPEQSRRSELIGLSVAVVVLLAAFGSVLAMAAPLLNAILGVALGLAAIRLVSTVLDISEVAPTLASMIGIAVGIDYALFVVARHRQHLAEGHDLERSIALANATAGQSVVFAGATVVIAILGLALIGVPLIATMGVAVSLTVAAAVLLAVTLLPALLGLVGSRIDRYRVPGVRLRVEVDATTSSSLSARWARRVSTRPWLALGVALLVLTTLALPALSLETGWPDARNRPEGTPARVAYDLLTNGFGPGSNGPLLVVADLDGAESDAAEQIAAALADVAGVAQVTPAIVNGAGDAAVLRAVPTTGPQEAETRQLVDDLRAHTIPNLQEETGATIEVTGATAAYIDLSERMESRLPLFISAVVLLSFILLTIVFRAPVVALKAAAMNLLGIGAAYGVVVAVFQWGWGSTLVGIEEPVPVIAFLPIMMFAILFGLSMDYEVFILSRVREAWVKTGDTKSSIVQGIAQSARVITAAALIMVSVFGSFVLGDSVEIKMFGVGLASAVLIDATIIRLILVPATMTLLGDRNWWLPSWLDTALPHLDHSATDTEAPSG